MLACMNGTKRFPATTNSNSNSNNDGYVDPATLELFSGCDRREMRSIEALFTAIDVPAGKVVTRQGATGDECILIGKGSVVVERDGETVAHVGPGQMIGEIALLQGRSHKRNATVRAATDCALLVFSVSDFERLIAEHPTVAARITHTAVQRLAEDLDHVEHP